MRQILILTVLTRYFTKHNNIDTGIKHCIITDMDLETQPYIKFQVLTDCVSTAQLERMCVEMDQAQSTLTPDLGRTAHTLRSLYRYKINNLTKFTKAHHGWWRSTAHKWARNIVNQYTPDNSIAMLAFVRQEVPTGIHMDHSVNMGPGHTFILPLRDIAPNDSTIVYDVDGRGTSASNQSNIEAIKLSTVDQPVIHDDRVSAADVAHCGEWPTKLPVLGRFYYRLGDAVCFAGHLLHCSNNWVGTDKPLPRHPESHELINKDNRTHRDYLIIHTATPGSQDFVQEYEA